MLLIIVLKGCELMETVELTEEQRTDLKKEISERSRKLRELIVKHVPKAELNALDMSLHMKFKDVYGDKARINVLSQVYYIVNVEQDTILIERDSFRGRD